MSDLVLEVQNIRKTYLQTTAVDDVSFRVQEGEILSLAGESGCGKSTLLRIVAGLEAHDHGAITLAGKDITDLKPEKRRFGFVFQNLSLFPHLNVEKNVFFGLPRKEQSEKELDELLDMTGMSGLGKRYPNELSGGQQQRVALARALAIKPQLLILDEPFSSLDELLKTKIRDEIFELLRQLKLTTIMVSHQASDSFLIADQLIIMRHGKVIQTGTPIEVYNKPSSEYVSDFFGASVIIKGKKEEGSASTSFGNLALSDLPETFTLFMRPENIAVVSKAEGNIAGLVKGKQFKGPHDVLTIQSHSSEETFQFETERCPHKVGDDIFLHVPQESIRIFD